MSKLIAMAKIPEEVVEAFSSAKDLQHRWVKLLAKAHESQPQALLARAAEIAADRNGRTAKQILDALLGLEKSPQSRQTLQEVEIRIGPHSVGRLALRSDGSVTMCIDDIDAEGFKLLTMAIELCCADIAAVSGQPVDQK